MKISILIDKLKTEIETGGDRDILFYGMDEYGHAETYEGFNIDEVVSHHILDKDNFVKEIINRWCITGYDL